MKMSLSQAIRSAADAVQRAEALLIGAGAGMGVDSGMPDFRGPEGFWKAYPAFRGRHFAEMSNPIWFESDPQQAWGFFGHRHNLYRDTQPHPGFAILRRWAESMPLGAGVFTSNVDGHFQKAEIDACCLVECHGSINHLQCSKVCSSEIWSADDLEIDVDPETIRARSPLPHCPNCEAVARPNILMFGDYEWLSHRTDEQEREYRDWRRAVPGKDLVVIEMGAGMAIPTVRSECELAGGTLIRINPRDPEASDDAISLPLGAHEALQRIQEAMADC